MNTSSQSSCKEKILEDGSKIRKLGEQSEFELACGRHRQAITSARRES
jgi:hypothetical protein